MAKKVDIAKRREIMRRSVKIGACICDPRRKCPCDVFKDHGLCPCAGERPDTAEITDVKLTHMVHNAGCASKIPAGDLQDLLAALPQRSDPRVLVGSAAGDDAGVFDIGDNKVLVQTVDVFTPCVDGARSFGRICAANCLSDIYAMGAKPITALSIVCFPIETIDSRVLREMMTGAVETFNEAGVSLIGGHSVKDEETKLGFAITAIADRNSVLTRDNLSEGDLLVLTKPLGVGVLNFARQIEKASDAQMAAAESWMSLLNRDAAIAATQAGASACTDITGFGLFGHLIGMLRAAGRDCEVYADKLPAMDGALCAFKADIIPGAVERNREYVAGDICETGEVDPIQKLLGFDGQTSGGLLIAISSDKVDSLLEKLSFGVVVGKIGGESDGKILLCNSTDTGKSCCNPSVSEKSCCCESPATKPKATSCCSGDDKAISNNSCCCEAPEINANTEKSCDSDDKDVSGDSGCCCC